MGFAGLRDGTWILVSFFKKNKEYMMFRTNPGIVMFSNKILNYDALPDIIREVSAMVDDPKRAALETPYYETMLSTLLHAVVEGNLFRGKRISDNSRLIYLGRDCISLIHLLYDKEPNQLLIKVHFRSSNRSLLFHDCKFLLRLPLRFRSYFGDLLVRDQLTDPLKQEIDRMSKDLKIKYEFSFMDLHSDEKVYWGDYRRFENDIQLYDGSNFYRIIGDADLLHRIGEEPEEKRFRAERSHYDMLWHSMRHRIAELYWYGSRDIFSCRRYVVTSSDCLSFINLRILKDACFIYVYWRAVSKDLILADLKFLRDEFIPNIPKLFDHPIIKEEIKIPEKRFVYLEWNKKFYDGDPLKVL